MYNLGIISIENKGIAKFTVTGEHIILRAIKLRAKTDLHDTVVEESVKFAFRNKLDETDGHIFILTDTLKNTDTVFIVPTPDCVMPTLEIKDKIVYIKTFGYPVSVGSAPAGGGERLSREWYRLQYNPASLHTMSNTWGDRNGRSRVNDEFIRREIESGADLGLDVVQIDDGWQTGIPETYADDGLRIFEGDFWELKSEIFPNGIRPLSDYAKEHGVELGLWFAPHSRNNFENFERDIGVLKKACDEWNIRYFKLDMISLPDTEHSFRMLDFLDTVYGLCDGISVELDVTADERLGYLMSAPYGTIFVENRYTAWENYYPHRTLRNLWSLSRFIPASKFQFELVNPDLCDDKYDKCDPYRPSTYDIDYLFASVMLSNPLFWMETQFLSDKNREKLRAIISKWRKHREELAAADVRPIGEMPSGASMTGFAAVLDDCAHLVLFRECTDREEYAFDVKMSIGTTEIIASNGNPTLSMLDGKLTVKFDKMRSYVWLKVNKS